MGGEDFMTLLQRSVLAELLRIFAMALTVLMVILLFVGILNEAVRNGLGAEQIVKILPFIVPSMLPFTLPATLLVAVCVVYSRMAGDQEITALKAAGISVMTIIWPALVLGGVLSLGTLILTDQFIPWSRTQIQRTITLAMEDIFLDALRSQSHMVDSRTGISISVMAVDGHTLVEPTFRYRPRGGAPVHVRAKRADIDFDLERQEVLLRLHGGYIERGKTQGWMKNQLLRFPLPNDRQKFIPRDLTIQTLERELARLDRDQRLWEQRQALTVALALSTGEFGRINAEQINHFHEIATQHTEKYGKVRTEIHSRYALACSCFFFALLGTPFSIWQAKRHFLMSFAFCFFPILLCYYPLVIGAMTLSKTYLHLHPGPLLWTGNAVLGVLALYVLRRVLRN